MITTRRRVVVLGGGYGGVRAAYDLSRHREPKEIGIVLVSKSADHVEVPLFYEVATAFLERESTQSSETVAGGVAVPLSDIFSGRDVRIRIGTITTINDRERMLLFADKTTLTYDYLIIAIGAESATYGIPGVLEHAFSVKTLEEAIQLRHHIVRLLRRREVSGAKELSSALRFVVVGGGATGVETAAELAHLARKIQYHNNHVDKAQVILLEAGDTILREVPESVRQYAQKCLAKWGVEVRTAKTVTAIESDHLALSDGTMLPTQTVVWCGGLMPHRLLVRSGLPVERWGVAVHPTLQVLRHPHLFAVGDAAMLATPSLQAPATVPVAYGQGILAARNCLHLVRREQLEQYRLPAQRQLITIGGKQAIALWNRRRSLTGWWPWLLKRLVSLRYWLGYLPWTRALSVWTQGIWVYSKND